MDQQPTFAPQVSPPSTVTQPQPTLHSTPLHDSTPPVTLPSSLKRRSLLWLWILLGVVGLLVVAGIIMFAVAYSSVQARGAATSYMSAVQSGDSSKLKQLSADNDSADSAYIRNATEGLKGATFSIANISDKKDQGILVNFDVKSSATIKDTAVLVKSGKVTSFNLNTRNADATREAAASTTTSQSQSSSQCLTAAIVKKSTSDGYAPQPYSPSGYQTAITEFFEADSSNYDPQYGSSQLEEVNILGDWMKTYSDKKYHVEITAKVQEGTLSPAGAALAASRAEKVKTDLVNRGAPASKITITEPEATKGDTEFEQGVYRNVTVTVYGDC